MLQIQGCEVLDSERVRIKGLKDQILNISVCFEFKSREALDSERVRIKGL
jgi:hypothetical protein